MPTFEQLPRFAKDWADLDPDDKDRFRAAVRKFIADLERGEGFRAGLRVKRVVGTEHVWELTWAPDGRVTWQYGDAVVSGQPHVIWRRVGTHDVFGAP